jgi:hypothetical protein
MSTIPPYGGGTAVGFGTPAPASPSFDMLGTLVPGLASAFRGSINAYVQGVEYYARWAQYHVEMLAKEYGYGQVSGGTITAGAALWVGVTAYEAVVGNYVQGTAAGTVGGLADDATSYIWLRQDGTWSSGTVDTLPGTADGHGAALKWGEALCGGGSVQTVTNTRQWFRRQWGATAIPVNAPGTLTLEPTQYCYPVLPFSGTVVGTVVVVLPNVPYASWQVWNGGTAALRFQKAGGSGTALASNSGGVILHNGTDYILPAGTAAVVPPGA